MNSQSSLLLVSSKCGCAQKRAHLVGKKDTKKLPSSELDSLQSRVSAMKLCRMKQKLPKNARISKQYLSFCDHLDQGYILER